VRRSGDSHREMDDSRAMGASVKWGGDYCDERGYSNVTPTYRSGYSHVYLKRLIIINY